LVRYFRWTLAIGLLLTSLSAGQSSARSAGASTAALCAAYNQLTIGQERVSPTPPQGFDPVTASDADLNCFGFPSRPAAGSQGLATWTWFMQHAKVRAQNIDGPPLQYNFAASNSVPRARSAMNNIGNLSPAVWAGYVATPNTAVAASPPYPAFPAFPAFGAASLAWKVQPGQTGDNHQLGVWAGTGGVNAGEPLLQAGVETLDGPRPSYYFFYEILDPATGCCKPVPKFDIPIGAGDKAFVQVEFQPQYQNAKFFVENGTTGKYLPYNVPAKNSGTGTAEWVFEDADATSCAFAHNNCFLKTYPRTPFESPEAYTQCYNGACPGSGYYLGNLSSFNLLRPFMGGEVSKGVTVSFAQPTSPIGSYPPFCVYPTASGDASCNDG